MLPKTKKIKKTPRNKQNNHYDNRANFKHKTSFNAKMNKNNPYYQNQPDFNLLAMKYPSFEKYVFINTHGITTIDWKDPKACIELNKALLDNDFKIKYWDIPEENLCPPIPSRVNYLNWIHDLLKEEKLAEQNIKIKGIDIGTGASLIYPILGLKLYGWHFIATDIDDESLENARNIIKQNEFEEMIQVRKSDGSIFRGVVQKDEIFTFSMCNPPFFENIDKKIKHPGKHGIAKLNELVVEGGEEGFIYKMILESIDFQKQIRLFTTLIGRKVNIKLVKEQLKQAEKILNEGNVTKEIKIKIWETTFFQGKTARWGIAWIFH